MDKEPKPMERQRPRVPDAAGRGRPRRNGPYVVLAILLFGILFALAGFLIARDVVRRLHEAPPPGKAGRGSEEAPGTGRR